MKQLILLVLIFILSVSANNGNINNVKMRSVVNPGYKNTLALLTVKTRIMGYISSLSGLNLFEKDKNIRQMPELVNENRRKIIHIPDIMGYKTLKCDFHMHTVFSDGLVWPTVRVDEAWEDGLDAIAITDHIENNPSKSFLSGDDNSSYEIAAPYAKQRNIILIKGGEISRSMPPGHFNALFLSDVNKLDVPDYMDAFKAASEQGAYIIWNHPGWKAQQPDTCKWWDIHSELKEKGWLHGIEVFNEQEWYPLALDWCNDKNLTYIATSDIHGLIANTYNVSNLHRPVTLVFAAERTEAALREALFANRTVAWFGNYLAGSEELLSDIFEASVVADFAEETKKSNTYNVKNLSDVAFNLASADGTRIKIPAYSETRVNIPKNSDLRFEVTNLMITATRNLEIDFPATK